MQVDQLRCERDEFARLLQAEGVGSATHYPRAISDQPIMAELVPEREPMPISELLATQALCLPVHHDLTDEQIDRIVEAVTKVATAMAR